MNSLLQKYLEQQMYVQIIYLSNNGSFTQRKIQILEVKNDIIRAYCTLRKMNRSFKISKILSLRPIRKLNDLG